MKKNVYNKLKAIVEKGYVKRNFDLIEYNTYRVHCIAKTCVIINSIETFAKTMVICNECGIKPIILGNGSNVILKNAKIDGVVIIFGSKFSNVYNIKNYVIAEAGTSLAKVMSYAKSVGLSGIENLSGIPASIGGAVAMNAGAFGEDIGKYVSSALVYHNGKISEWKKEDFDFGYRYSRLQDNDAIVLRVELKLVKKNKEEIDETIRDIISKRNTTQKLLYPCAGSVFKNGNNYFAGELIDKCGLKNYNINNAYVSDFHANFIENRGNATGEDIVELIECIRNVVLDKFGINLELEQKIIGEK